MSYVDDKRAEFAERIMFLTSIREVKNGKKGKINRSRIRRISK